MNARKIWLFVAPALSFVLGLFAISVFIYWGQDWGSGRDVDPPADPKWEKLRKEAGSPQRTPEYLESLEKGKRVDIEDHALVPSNPKLSRNHPASPDPIPNIPDDKPVLGELPKGKFPDMAALFGLGLPDATPMTKEELESAIQEIGDQRELLTLAPVEKPGGELAAPLAVDEELLRLYSKLRELKAKGKISNLAIRAIRNGHVEVSYSGFTYGQPSVVQSIKPATKSREGSE